MSQGYTLCYPAQRDLREASFNYIYMCICMFMYIHTMMIYIMIVYISEKANYDYTAIAGHTRNSQLPKENTSG